MSRVLNVRLSHGGNVLAEGSLAIPNQDRASDLSRFTSRISQYSGSHYIGGVHVDASIGDAPEATPAELPVTTTEEDMIAKLTASGYSVSKHFVPPRVSTVKSPKAPRRPATKKQPKVSKPSAKKVSKPGKKPARKTKR